MIVDLHQLAGYGPHTYQVQSALRADDETDDPARLADRLAAIEQLQAVDSPQSIP